MRRAALVPLPKGVFRVAKGARVYWFHQERRGKPNAGPLTRLPEPGTREWHEKLAEIMGRPPGPPAGSFAELIAAYQAGPHWKRLTEGTRKTYAPCLRQIVAWWGDLAVSGLRPKHIAKAVETEYADRPAMGDMTVKVLRAVMRWGASRDWENAEPARAVERLHRDVESARPWPEDVWWRVVRDAPAPVARMAVLGRATGQRVSDLVKMRPADRDSAGICLRITKLRGKLHWAPVSPELLAIIDGWRVFPNARYIHNERTGRPVGKDDLRKSLLTFLAGIDAGHLTIHGLRAMAVCDRRMAGLSHQEIAAQIGMSFSMVGHYSKHMDQRLAAEGGANRRTKG